MAHGHRVPLFAVAQATPAQPVRACCVQAVTNDACTDAHADKLDGNGSELAVPPTAITMTPKVIISEMGITAAERSAGQLLEKLTHLSLDKETSKKYAQVLSAVTISPGIITSLCADDEAA